MSAASLHFRLAFLLAATAALGWTGPVLAAKPIFKCLQADGKTTFRDSPCPAAAAQREVQLRGGTAQETDPAAAAAAEAAAKRARDPNNCSSWQAPDQKLVVELPKRVDPDQLPQGADGKPLQLFLEQHGPATVAAACSAMVSACYHQNDDASRTLDACFESAPRCTTARPWEEAHACCPDACWQKYVELRRHCVDATSASYKALFEEHCVAAAAPAPDPASP